MIQGRERRTNERHTGRNTRLARKPQKHIRPWSPKDPAGLDTLIPPVAGCTEVLPEPTRDRNSPIRASGTTRTSESAAHRALARRSFYLTCFAIPVLSTARNLRSVSKFWRPAEKPTSENWRLGTIRRNERLLRANRRGGSYQQRERCQKSRCSISSKWRGRPAEPKCDEFGAAWKPQEPMKSHLLLASAAS